MEYPHAEIANLTPANNTAAEWLRRASQELQAFCSSYESDDRWEADVQSPDLAFGFKKDAAELLALQQCAAHLEAHGRSVGAFRKPDAETSSRRATDFEIEVNWAVDETRIAVEVTVLHPTDCTPIVTDFLSPEAFREIKRAALRGQKKCGRLVTCIPLFRLGTRLPDAKSFKRSLAVATTRIEDGVASLSPEEPFKELSLEAEVPWLPTVTLMLRTQGESTDCLEPIATMAMADDWVAGLISKKETQAAQLPNVLVVVDAGLERIWGPDALSSAFVHASRIPWQVVLLVSAARGRPTSVRNLFDPAGCLS